MPAKLELHLLGKLRIVLDGRSVTDTLSVKAQALLCYLAVTGEVHPRHALAGLLWGDAPEEKAKNSLRVTLAALRKLCPEHLTVTHQTIAFNRDSAYWLDTDAFAKEIAGERRQPGDDKSPISNLQSPISRYRGDFLQDFFVEEAILFEEWLLSQRTYWQQLALSEMAGVTEVLLARRAYTEAVIVLQRRLDIEPWLEEAQRQLMLTYARQGNYNAALAQYDICCHLLETELGVEPMPETTSLFQRIQVARQQKPAHLPADNSPFIGREAALSQLHQMLIDPDCRLVTITGYGGMGKTRLALTAAQQANREQAVEFLNGVTFISLVDVETAANLPLALANALNMPLVGRHPAAELINYLGNKEMLLVLDNFEHLLTPSPANGNQAGTGLLTQILNACPHVKMLVTSREPLQLAAEWRLELDGLAYPGNNEPLAEKNDPAGNDPLDDYPAVQLFVQAAQQVQPAYQPAAAEMPHIVHLCRLVGGVPLALKLAAAWLRVIPCEQLVAEIERDLDILATQMRDVLPRQRSMRAIFDYAWSHLADEARHVLAALSLFHGGFGREAAVKVAGASLPILATLVEKSLVRMTPSGRYQMHELLRQFAAEKLAETAVADTTIRNQHSAYYLKFLKKRAETLVGPEQQTVLAELDQEIFNAQAAWKWTGMQNDLDAIDPVIDVLYNYYWTRSRFQEGKNLFSWLATHWQQSDALRQHPRFQLVLARLLARWGAFSTELQDFEAAQQLLQAALNLSEHPRHKAFVLHRFGWLVVEQGQRARAEAYLSQSLKISRELGDQSGVANALLGLTKAALEFGDMTLAAELGRQGLEVSRKLARPDWIANALGLLAWPICCMGAYDESEAYYKESLAIHQEIGNPLGAATAINFLGWIAWCVGGQKAAKAIPLHEKALATYRELAHDWRVSMCLGDLALAWMEQDNFEQAKRCASEGLMLAQEIDVIHLIDYNLYIMGAAHCGLGDLQTGEDYLMQALQNTLQTGKTDHLMNILFSFAQLLLKESEAAGDEDTSLKKQTQAFALLSLVVDNPFTWQVYRDKASHLRDEQVALLPEAVRTAVTTPALPQEWPQDGQQFIDEIIRSV